MLTLRLLGAGEDAPCSTFDGSREVGEGNGKPFPEELKMEKNGVFKIDNEIQTHEPEALSDSPV